jgi:23S rRNA (cytidine1920-2'-O)/16S rRNA (cytidine1409-2'-O)-methyltransferase
MKRPRLDVWLVEQGLAESRQKAQALVMAGRVKVGGEPAHKPGTPVPPEAPVELVEGPRHVGRGAFKLAGALERFGLDPTGRVAVDVGASTGGFTEQLLERGAARVYAVDVGRNQLHERLRGNPRVVPVVGVNARYLSRREIPEPCGLATIDVSFISILKILPALRRVLSVDASVVALVKPQFEVGRRQVGRGGLVKDPALHREVLGRVAQGAQDQRYSIQGACASPIAGSSGNREFFLLLRPEGAPAPPDALQLWINQAVDS